MIYETRAGAYIKKQLDAGSYILTIEYDTTETFGNKGRITKTASTEFDLNEPITNTAPGGLDG